MAADRLQDLRRLPKLRDSLSYLYVEHCRIDRDQRAIAIWGADGMMPVPCASLALLMVGPGASITHAAISALADNNCLVAWTGEQGVRMYAFGTGGTRSSSALIRQAALVSDPAKRTEVARRMYHLRFREEPDPSLNIEQLRGWEGRRVRDAYAHASAESGIPWQGRAYERDNWGGTDPVNRSLSAANSCLYGICHAAILSMGLSPALGFIHTGKQLSFVYDIADLYKTVLTIPIAFRCAAGGTADLERRTRLACRDAFREIRLLERLSKDLPRVLELKNEEIEFEFAADSDDPAAPSGLWDPTHGVVAGGANHSQGDPGYTQTPGAVIQADTPSTAGVPEIDDPFALE